jgi:transcription elongation factor Elf1
MERETEMEFERICKACKESFETKFRLLETKIDSNKEIFDHRVETADRATELSRVEIKERMDKDNGIREEMRRKEETFLPRTEYSANHRLLHEKIEAIDKMASKMTGIMLAISFFVPLAVSIVMALIIHFFGGMKP